MCIRACCAVCLCACMTLFWSQRNCTWSCDKVTTKCICIGGTGAVQGLGCASKPNPTPNHQAVQGLCRQTNPKSPGGALAGPQTETSWPSPIGVREWGPYGALPLQKKTVLEFCKVHQAALRVVPCASRLVCTHHMMYTALCYIRQHVWFYMQYLSGCKRACMLSSAT